MKLNRLTSIRTSLIWLVTACLLPAILATAGLLVYEYRLQRTQLVTATLQTARSLTVAVNQEFLGVQLSLQALATSPFLQDQNFERFHAQASGLIATGIINNVALIDASGQQLLNTALPFGSALPKTSVMEQNAQIYRTGLASISGLATGAVLKTPIISVAVPVKGPQGVLYALTGVILPSTLQKTMVAQGLPADRIVAIFDGKGVIAARSREIERFLGSQVAPDLAKRLVDVNEDAIELLTLEKIPVISVFSRSATTGWGAAIGIQSNVLTADLRKSMAVLAGLGTLLFATSLAVAWLLGGRISRSFAQLVEPALNLARGRAVQVPKLVVREADELGRALVLSSVVLESANDALKNSEARMRGILLSAMDAIISVDENQTIVLFNAAAASMFACPAEDAIGLPLSRFIPTGVDSLNQALAEQERAADAGGIHDVNLGLRWNGEEFPAEISGSSVVESGARLHTLIVRDVTSRVKAYKALERSNLDLQQFAYVASHDLKTPLRSIAGFVQILERNYGEQLDDKARNLIRRTADATRRLEQLTEDLLSFARIDAEAKAFTPVNMTEVGEEVVHLLDAAINSADAVVRIGDLPVVTGDRTQLVQLLLNLIGNGLKYCRDRAPVVELSAVLQEDCWAFSVADNGIGIDAKHLDRVFGVFKRLHSQTEFPGTGIGLAVCRRVVEGHGGKIWVESRPGHGSVFSFTMPC